MTMQNFTNSIKIATITVMIDRSCEFMIGCMLRYSNGTDNQKYNDSNKFRGLII